MIRQGRAAGVLAVASAGATAGLAGLGFGPVFGAAPYPAAFVIAVLSAAAAGTVAAVIGVLVPRLPKVVVALGGIAVVAGAVVVTTAPDSGVLNGPWLLLTGALPADVNGAGLSAVAAVTGWAALTAGLLSDGTRSALWALAPPLGCLVAGLGVGASGPALPAWHAPAFVIAAVAVLALSQRATRSPGSVVAAALVAVIAAVATTVLGPVAPGVGTRLPADARELVEAPVTPRTGVSPLQQFPALRAGIQPVRLSGTVSRHVDLLRMATLSQFDGTYWTVRADYRRAGTVLPIPPDNGVPLTTVTQQVRIVIPGPLAWLPTAGRPRTVDVGDLGVDEDSGDLVLPADRPIPDGYNASSVLPDLTPERIRAGTPDRTTSEMDVPAALRSFAEDAVHGTPSGSSALLALLTRFTGPATEFRLDESPDAPSGHGLFQIARLLEDHRGTAEQYASAYAVLARRLGYDARVVIGFRPQYPGGPDSKPFTVTEHDVDAWVEVHYSDLGWVPIDPTPRDKPIGATSQTAPETPRGGSQDAARQAAQDQALPHEPEATATIPPTPQPSSVSAALVALMTAAVLALAVLAIPIAKQLRRARRRNQPTTLAIAFAWQETLDRFRELGVRIPASLTRSEVVTLTSRTPLVSPETAILLTHLAHTADTTIYAPDPPTPADKTAAWTTTRHTRHQISRAAHPIRRVAAHMNPVVLFTRNSPW
ncbi:transglutaminase domain-containing protein [Actinokineospora sp. NBRC 105648]|uniref:transglutaminase family protein n=1 Tax=Actinokineospora sp. NBRC 105648 TaxID=3032206 RepID=UPI0024A0CB99|nr:transglutaminase domain-containing protein [Actinokineospora sp. NBRC 105648]GLZ40608.1 hypothetical protein Acsp05_42320 [Actinokineospora sp. NBRC 105648]